MEDYKRGSHAVWDCKYHLVWVTKYRYEVLAGDVGQRCRELLREIARSKEMQIYAGSINRNPRAHADLDPAQPFGIAGGAISEGAEFA
jgi:Transposase IS200 like